MILLRYWSCFYNPEWCGFINADGIIGANKDILSSNLYIYVSNNPIIFNDFNGYGFITALLIGVVVFATIKTVVTTASNIYLATTGCAISNEMFNKAMYNPIGNISKGTQKKIMEESRGSKEVKDAIKGCVKNSNGKSFDSSECKGSFEFKTGDLYYSIHNDNYEISGNKIDSSLWNINIKMNDVYDFTKIWKGTSKGALANNLGFFMQHTGMLIPYKWEVNYNMTYYE